jgi:hypothetical protein
MEAILHDNRPGDRHWWRQTVGPLFGPAHAGRAGRQASVCSAAPQPREQEQRCAPASARPARAAGVSTDALRPGSCRTKAITSATRLRVTPPGAFDSADGQTARDSSGHQAFVSWPPSRATAKDELRAPRELIAPTPAPSRRWGSGQGASRRARSSSAAGTSRTGSRAPARGRKRALAARRCVRAVPVAAGRSRALLLANLGTEPRRPASPASLLARVCRAGANSSACCATVAARRGGRASPGRSTHRSRTRLVRRLQRQQLDGQRRSRRALFRPAKRAQGPRGAVTTSARAGV